MTFCHLECLTVIWSCCDRAAEQAVPRASMIREQSIWRSGLSHFRRHHSIVPDMMKASSDRGSPRNPQVQRRNRGFAVSHSDLKELVTDSLGGSPYSRGGPEEISRSRSLTVESTCLPLISWPYSNKQPIIYAARNSSFRWYRCHKFVLQLPSSPMCALATLSSNL